MEAPHPTAGWEKVGDRFYRKTQLYTAVFDQDLDLDNYIVAGAPYGGAIGTPPSAFVLVSPGFPFVVHLLRLGLPLTCVMSALKWVPDATPSLH